MMLPLRMLRKRGRSLSPRNLLKKRTRRPWRKELLLKWK
jgi:hypothetical protein